MYFADSLSRFLGTPIYSILKGKLEGKPIPCSWNGVRGRGTRRCDSYGHEIELATISDNSHWRESTAIEKAIYESMMFAGMQVSRQDNLTFRGLVPPTAADGDRMAERAPLVPDLKASISYDEGKTPEQDFIFDVKTTRRSATTDYKCRDAYNTPHGVVDKRAAAVPGEYVQKAKKADKEYASRATRSNTSDSGSELDGLDLDNGQTQSIPSGPVESKLRELPPPDCRTSFWRVL